MSDLHKRMQKILNTEMEDDFTRKMTSPVGKAIGTTVNASQKIRHGVTRNLSFNGIKRISQTTFALEKAAFRWIRNREQPLPLLMRDTMQDLGATYIKLGQMIASSPSLFPYEYVEAFQSFLDQAPALPYKEIDKVLKQELGKDYRQLFRSIDETPLACASIAQVHAAVWSNGDPVVIKVQNPGVRDTLETEFQCLYLVAKLAVSDPKARL